MTTFKRCIQSCGLSQQEAASFLGVSLQSVKHWSSGKTTPKEGVFKELAVLYRDIQKVIDPTLNILDSDGIDSCALSSFAVDIPEVDLPNESSREMAGAIALLEYFAPEYEKWTNRAEVAQLVINKFAFLEDYKALTNERE